MTISRFCLNCGARLADEGPGGNCPNCLFALAAAVAPEAAPRSAGLQPGSFEGEPHAGPETGAPSSPTQHATRNTPPVLHYFGDYELIEEIARGGMGVVYRARQVSLNRTVAVKVLLFGQFASDEFVQRFRTEAEAAANLHHPNIVAIHEIGEHDGRQYFSMDYVEGGHLGDMAREQPLPARRAASLLKTIAEAVHHAHQRGVLHRDLKPSNVLIDSEGQPRLTDFGLAKRLAGTHSTTSESSPEKFTDAVERVPTLDLTLTGQVLGTPNYASPEQAGGRRGAVTAASDVYSLGAILYFLLAGRPPFLGESLEETLDRVRHDEPIPPRLLNPSVPGDLETICLKCLNKEPPARYASAQDLADDLGRFLDGEPIHARPAGRAEKLWRWCRRKPALAALLVALHVVGAAGLGGILWQWQRAERHADAAQHHAEQETAQRQRAQQAVTILELQRVEDLVEKDEVTLGVAYLARMVRQQPTNQIAARRLLSALTQRSFALPIARMLHTRRITSVDFSPDGWRMVTTCGDHSARIWDGRTGAFVFALQHSNEVQSSFFSPDGGRLMTVESGSPTNGARVFMWNSLSGQAIGQPMHHEKTIRAAHFSPDAQRVLTASDDGTAKLWDAHTGEPLLPPMTHQAPINDARFSLDGRWVVTASKDKTAQVWNSERGQPTAPPLRHDTAVKIVRFSPNGQWVLTATDKSTCVWDVNSGEPRSKPLVHAFMVASMEFSPEGERIVISLHDGLTRIYNARDGTLLAAPMQHCAWTTVAEFGPDGHRVLTASLDSTARLWDAISGQALTAPFQHDGLIWNARFSPDSRFAVTGSADKTARLWDVRIGIAQGGLLQNRSPVLQAMFSPDGEWIVTGSEQGSVGLWRVRTGKPEDGAIKHLSGIREVAFSPNGTRLATASVGGTARLWDPRTGKPSTPPMLHDSVIDNLCFSPDGRFVATASRKPALLRLWNAETGELVGQPVHNVSQTHSLSFSPNGRLLLSTRFKDDTAQVWEIPTWIPHAEFRGHEGYILHAEFSPDGERLLTASEDGTARLWGTHTGQMRTPPLRHKAVVQYAHQFSRDGTRVVTASEDMTAQVWDTATGQPVGEPLRHRNWVRHAAFSPEGALVATASRDATVRLWDAKTGRAVTEPFRHDGNVHSAHFSLDGRRLLVAADSGPQLWDVPATVSADGTARLEGTLLADLAELMVGKRVNAQGALDSVPFTGLDEMRRRVATLPREADFTRWLEWFFADRSVRAISPYSEVNLPHYIRTRAMETNFASMREALILSPNYGLGFGRLAGHHLREDPAPGSDQWAAAEWASRQALRFAPADSYAWWCRRRILQRTGDWARLLEESEAALRAYPTNASAGNAKAHALEKLQRFEDMLAACDRALADWQADVGFHWDQALRRDLLLKRGLALRFLNRLPEAGAAIAETLGLPPRDPITGPNLVNLNAFFTEAIYDVGPTGIRHLAGTDFDFRAWIHLDLSLVRSDVTHLPKRVEGIPIERACQRLHFLHTVCCASHLSRREDAAAFEELHVPLGQTVGHYLIHYADGQEVTIPILHGRDVRDLWHWPESIPDDPALVVAWTGSSEASRKHGATVRFYKSTWENPRPAVPVTSLDFVHAGTHAVPILLAITAEP